MEKHIYFIRHGESESNVDDIYRDAAASLTERGQMQATLAAQQMAHIELSELFASDFSRAIDTADAVAKATGLSTKQHKMFGEWREPTILFGKHKKDPEARKVMTQIRTASSADYQYSDEERFDELTTRVREAITFLEEHDAQNICVVTHGGFLRVLLGNLLLGDFFTGESFMQSFKKVSIHNTGITHVIYNPEHGWKVVSFNDHHHLSDDIKTC